MQPPIKFPYKTYKGISYPIISFKIKGPKGWLEIEALVDSGASLSVLLPSEANALGIDYAKGKVVYSTVGDGSLIPVYLHVLPVKIGTIAFRATIGISPRLGVEFNLLGRRDIFRRFDILFSDSTKTISFLPRKE